MNGASTRIAGVDVVGAQDRDATAPAIRVRGVSKNYRRMGAGFRLRTLKSALLQGSLTAGLSAEESIRALRDVDFEVGRGEAFGVIGGNGSGKSTLLKLVAGLVRPSSGVVEVEGRVAALIELGAGFHPEISGRENVFINGSVLGLERREIERRFDDIVEFSGLEDFIDEPVKNYSSGMYVRLGFAVAIHTDPDVLLVDEVLAVGDEAFAHRCLRRIEEHLARGRSILFVSHSLDLVEDLCDRVLWLEHGEVRALGSPRKVIDAYRELVARQEGEEHRRELDRRSADGGGGDRTEASVEREAEATSSPDDRRWGSRQAEIVAARLLVGGREDYVMRSGSPASIEIEVDAATPLDDFVFGIAISTPRGVECWGTNTDLAGFKSRSLRGAARIEVHCPSLCLAPGEYDVDVAVHARNGAPYDYRRKLFRFTVHSQARGVGVYAPPHAWSFSGDVDLASPEPEPRGEEPTEDEPQGSPIRSTGEERDG
ncbi:MAG: ABC transporter ATP-binding protein [Acidobacteria bacterium]|nr:MAG: ABC transporter ATP-binding protein [Acidobacteriota bacterium]REJ99567.1 MAG: ABC transporter ATP-binding protein [Acidobacteriota bacterium]